MEDVVVTYDIHSLLASPQRDFLIRNNADPVKIDSLNGKRVGLYFSASWCGPCQIFTPKLEEVYNEVAPKGDFEIVFVSSDWDEGSFRIYFSKMPWLAIPFSDSETRGRLDELFHVKENGIPRLALLDETRKVVTENGVDLIYEHGVEAYPFTLARIQEFKHREEEAKRNQTLRSILVSPSRDFVISSNGNKTLVSELEGKTVGLYFSMFSYRSSIEFTPRLVEVYEKLKAKGEDFEVVLIPLDYNEESFKEGLKSVPWLTLPFKDESISKLFRYFDISALPTLVIVGPDEKTLQPNAADAILNHGIAAFPFTPEKFAQLEEIRKAKDDSKKEEKSKDAWVCDGQVCTKA
ncbi:hypothetical protein RJT34_02010 [Clitoria ternatea]|uniref:protein-disulfide reductase n=1 Tax=Clitoria ternatea TaxID=43366 RepID=A0AAN9KKV4_CLITE